MTDRTAPGGTPGPADDGSPDDDNDDGGRATGRRRGPRHAFAVAVAAMALAAATGVGTRGTASGDRPVPDLVARLQAEVDAMVAAGMPPDHPKVELLQAEVDALAEGWGQALPDEPGVDLRADADAGELPGSPDEARRRADEVRPAQPAVAGTVECEPIPQRLGAEELAGARCLSVPQPDGSSLYVALTPDGTVHTVSFAAGGNVERREDAALPPGTPAEAVTLAPTPAGDVEVRSGPDALTTLDLG